VPAGRGQAHGLDLPRIIHDENPRGGVRETSEIEWFFAADEPRDRATGHARLSRGSQRDMTEIAASDAKGRCRPGRSFPRLVLDATS